MSRASKDYEFKKSIIAVNKDKAKYHRVTTYFVEDEEKKKVGFGRGRWDTLMDKSLFNLDCYIMAYLYEDNLYEVAVDYLIENDIIKKEDVGVAELEIKETIKSAVGEM